MIWDQDSESGPQIRTYARYNVPLETGWNQLAIDRTPDALAKIAAMDDPNNTDAPTSVGSPRPGSSLSREYLPATFGT
jgi:hypothetical protein